MFFIVDDIGIINVLIVLATCIITFGLGEFIKPIYVKLFKDYVEVKNEKYKITLERTNARFKREEAFNLLHKNQNLKSENIAYNVNDVISDFGDDIDWDISPSYSHKRG